MVSQESIEVFQSITGADADVAEHCLEAYQGDLDRAVSHFLDSGGSYAPRPMNASNGARASSDSVINIASPEDNGSLKCMADAKQRLATSETRQSHMHSTRQRNQGYLEEEAALQRALAASGMDAGNGVVSGGSAPGSTRGVAASELSRHLSIESNDSEEIDEYEPEVESDIEMDTEEEFMRKVAAAQQARNRLAAGVQSSVPSGSDPSPGMTSYMGGRDSDLPDMPAGIDVEEARMLEAALLNIPYTGRIPEIMNGSFGRGAHGNDYASVSPAVQEQRSVWREQDCAYEQSLQADRERAAAEEAKAAAALAAAQAESAARAAEQERQQQAEQAHAQQLAAKKAALLPEPAAGMDVVTVAIKLPDGQRLTRRFLLSSPLEAVYHYVDVAGPSASGPDADYQPGSYLLVGSRPRKVHQSSSERSLADAGFEKQEMLMLEPK